MFFFCFALSLNGAMFFFVCVCVFVCREDEVADDLEGLGLDAGKKDDDAAEEKPEKEPDEPSASASVGGKKGKKKKRKKEDW